MHGMKILTYADRESLLEELERLSDLGVLEDSALMEQASAAVARVRSSFGFVDILSREIAALCAFLRQSLGDAARRRARGVLAFVAQRLTDESTSIADLGGVQAAAFLAGLVAHETRKVLGQPSTYKPYSLSRQDRQQAEDLLLAFVEQPLLSDHDLLRGAEHFQEVHSGLRGSGIFGRLLRNTEILTGILGAHDASAEHQAWSRAALSYVIEKDDVIEDRLGLVGLLDDAFAVNTVVDILSPEFAPWLDLLDATVEAWPFLNALVFHDDDGGHTASEHLIVNAALACPALRGNGSAMRTALILPSVGPTPLMVGLMASLGVLQDWLLAEDSPITFERGETVCVDNDGYAHFDGFVDWEGERWIVLRYWDRAGRKRAQWLPAGHLQRLTPAPPRERPLGPVPSRWEQGKGRLSAIEYLFHLERPRPANGIGKRVILVTPTGRARRLAASLHLCGLPIQDCFPIGHVTLVDGPPTIWSSRFSSLTEPVLLVVSDLDDAAQILADDPAQVALVILDLRGVNAGRFAGLEATLRVSSPILAISDEAEQRAIEALHERGFVFWEWSKEELQQLVWPVLQPGTSLLARYNRRIHWFTSVDPTIEEIEEPGLSEVFQALQRLQDLVRNRGEDLPDELSQALSSGWSVFNDLLRLENRGALGDRLRLRQERLAQLEKSCGSGIWLLDEECQAIRNLCRVCQHALEVMDQGSPRARRLEILLEQQPAVSVIVRRAREREEILSAFGLAPEKVFTPDEVPEDGFDSGATVVGWLGRTSMTRLLHPPIADPLTLLLYPIELRWYHSLLETLERSRQRRRPPMSRQAIFPAISWKPPRRPRPAVSQSGPPPVRELETMDWGEVFSRRVAGLRGATSSADPGLKCDACFTLFTDERFAFLSPHRRLAVVTALLDRTSRVTEPEVEERTVTELRPGDVLLLPISADRDVIRNAADRQLSVGDRDHATQWQKALKKHVLEQGLTIEQLRDQLAATGCHRHTQTIGQWLRSEDLIAPQNAYHGDLEAIAAVTGSPDFKNNLEICKAAITKVRHAHFTARRRLAEVILRQLGAEAVALGRLPKVQIEGDLALVRVELVDEKITQIPRSVANRLLEP